MRDPVQRVEWLQAPLDAPTEGRPAQARGGAVEAEACNWCGWLNGRGDDSCFRCGERLSGERSAGPILDDLGVSQPPIEVTLADGHFSRGKAYRSSASTELYALRLKAEKLLLARGEEDLWSRPTWRFDLYPHQERTARRVLAALRGRAILADEVGLGKTIEAGVVMSELLHRGLAGNVLILVPAALLGQWQAELAEKFGLELPIAAGPEALLRETRVIASLALARGSRCRNAVLTRSWDLLVVDEAHKLKRRSTLTYKTVNAIRKRYVLLLTATPVQNDLAELYNLANILKPGLLGSFKAFRRIHLADSAGRIPKQPERLRETLRSVMVRHRRADVGVRLPQRKAAIYHLSLCLEERTLYDQVTRYVREEYQEQAEDGRRALALVTLQRELCSSSGAVAATLGRMAAREEGRARSRLEALAQMARKVRGRTKVEALQSILKEHPGKILIYTDFLETQRFIASELARSNVSTVLYHGGLRMRERESIIKQFASPRVRAMISTSAGAEGLNLQFCHQLVNYDLPWNPMKVEQRIGRLHRLGQKSEVLVFNLSVVKTVEERVMDLLSHKIQLFRLIVGELDQILGRIDRESGLEREIADAYLGSETESAARKAFEKLGKEAAEARKEYLKTLKGATRLLDAIADRPSE